MARSEIVGNLLSNHSASSSPERSAAESAITMIVSTARSANERRSLQAESLSIFGGFNVLDPLSVLSWFPCSVEHEASGLPRGSP